MKSKTVMILTGVLVSVVLLSGACSVGFAAAQFIDLQVSKKAVLTPIAGLNPQLGHTDMTAQGSTPEELDELFDPFWQAWDLVHKDYVDQPVDDELLMQGAISGMLDALGDAHTSYLDPEDYEQSTARLEGEEYEGIGAWVNITGEFLTIISPMPNSPAEGAGLRPGDQVIAVNGKDVSGVDGETVRQQMLGPRGTQVILTIRRESEEEPFDVTLTRRSIVVPSVDGQMLEEENLAYVQLFTFGADTTQDLRKELRSLLAEDPDGLILDLRNNGGGYLQTAITVASEFISGGVLMYEERRDGTLTEFAARPGGQATDIPMVDLINEGSASASEIVAGAIQDRGRGQLVGVTSFGKGSVQNYTPLVNGQGAVRITIARWLTPDKRQIHEVGLTPDAIVEFTEEQYATGEDPQLEKAIDLLRKD